LNALLIGWNPSDFGPTASFADVVPIEFRRFFPGKPIEIGLLLDFLSVLDGRVSEQQNNDLK
jgi:hypothetical protein